MADADELHVRESVTSLAVISPPGERAGDEPVHDSARAMTFIQSMTTVDEILERQPDRPTAFAQPSSRSDLDYVYVGCWGRVVHVVDPGLASDFLHTRLTEEVANQEQRCPGARVIGEVYLDMGGEYVETVVSLPGVPRFVVQEWVDGTEVDGDLDRVLAALGMTPADIGEYFDPDTFEDWEREPVVQRALGGFDLDLLTAPDRDWSVFRVSRPDGVRIDMEEVWFGAPWLRPERVHPL